MQNVDANKLDLAKWRTYKKLPVFFCTYRKLLGEFCTYKKIPVRFRRTKKSLYVCKDDQNGVIAVRIDYILVTPKLEDKIINITVDALAEAPI